MVLREQNTISFHNDDFTLTSDAWSLYIFVVFLFYRNIWQTKKLLLLFGTRNALRKDNRSMPDTHITLSCYDRDI